jgi:2-oxoglutarate dehydrogenase complex dehydrogenase (E1) component-like enzyme
MNATKEYGERQWLAAAFEASASQPLTKDEKIRVAELLTKCDTFDNFMQVRYASVKRYGAEVRAALSSM